MDEGTLSTFQTLSHMITKLFRCDPKSCTTESRKKFWMKCWSWTVQPILSFLKSFPSVKYFKTPNYFSAVQPFCEMACSRKFMSLCILIFRAYLFHLAGGLLALAVAFERKALSQKYFQLCRCRRWANFKAFISFLCKLETIWKLKRTFVILEEKTSAKDVAWII